MFLKKLTLLNRKLIVRLNDLLSPYDLNNTDWRFFSYLSERQNSSLSEISTCYQMDKALTSRICSKLKNRGFIEFKNSNDKREKIITLSKDAKELYFDVSIKISELEKELLSEFDIMQKSIFLNMIDSINEKLY